MNSILSEDRNSFFFRSLHRGKIHNVPFLLTKAAMGEWKFHDSVKWVVIGNTHCHWFMDNGPDAEWCWLCVTHVDNSKFCDVCHQVMVLLWWHKGLPSFVQDPTLTLFNLKKLTLQPIHGHKRCKISFLCSQVTQIWLLSDFHSHTPRLSRHFPTARSLSRPTQRMGRETELRIKRK